MERQARDGARGRLAGRICDRLPAALERPEWRCSYCQTRFFGILFSMATLQRQQRREKTTGQSTGLPVGAMIPQEHGGALRNGGTNKGGPGRPPNEFRARMQELANYADRLGHIEAVLNDPGHAQWMAALRHVTEHGYGKPAQSVEVSGCLELETQVFVIGGKTITF